LRNNLIYSRSASPFIRLSIRPTPPTVYNNPDHYHYDSDDEDND